MTQSPPPPSLWAIKPWWCQPWSIVLTGLLIPALAWIVTHRLWVVIPIGLVILGWWFLFLHVVPKSYAEQAADMQVGNQ